MRERKKPQESWISKSKRELERQDYYFALRLLELKIIRKEKENKFASLKLNA